MSIGFSTCCDWAPLPDLKEIEIEDRGNPWFDDSDMDMETIEAIWVVLDPQNAPEHLSFTVGSETEEYLFRIDLTGATPVLEDEDGRILYIRKKGGATMWNKPTKEQLSKIPKLYETENVPLTEKLIYLHFFIGACDWYVAEYDGEDLLWGYAILNGDLEMAEWGYVSFEELKQIKIPPGFEIDCDRYWQIKKASDIEKIRMGNHWSETEEPKDNSSRKEKTDDVRTDLVIGRDH